MTVNFSDLAHVEITVPDTEEAYRILHNVLGAEKMQEDIELEATRISHGWENVRGTCFNEMYEQYIPNKIKQYVLQE